LRPWFAIAGGCWIVFLLYWFVSAFRRKAEKKREPANERLQHLIPVGVAYFLLFQQHLPGAWLHVRFVPDKEFWAVTGAVATAAGVALAIWARQHLGENWSATVTLREQHELIRTGPYRTMRHPIYTGVLLATIGTGLIVGEVRALLCLVIAAAAFYFKASKEERWLSQEFGARFDEHTKKTGMFLPRFS
jgi:protein-S-isoprenylcysteine O-methyltransferase Ste14